ncbi:MAG: VWA domain-containing protein, partial [Candidatus Sericytochromatia bacterium]
ALMEQERDDVFTLQVGNLPAKESLEIRLRFCQQLDYREEGLFELRLPMVVAPRYIPGQIKESPDLGQGVESDTDIVPDASRITPPRLAPGFDPQVDLKLQVELLLAPGESLSKIACSQHLTQTSLSGDKVLIELSHDDERLNRDFVLRWQASAATLRSRLHYLQGPAGEGYGLLQLSAPAGAALLESGRDVVFLLDRSGSMGDYKMTSASQACSLLLDSLGPRDRYAVLAFDDQMHWLEPDSVWQHGDEAGRAQGHRFLATIEARGGTELFEAIQQALGKVRARGGNGGAANTPILVILTDGQVGDESRILKAIQQELGEAIVYTIGIDTAVNDSFLTRLARLGGGSSVSVTPGEKLAAALKQIAGEIGFPALWDLETALPEIAPEPLPDLYQGRSLSVFFKGPLPAEPVLRAQGAKGPVSMQLVAEKVDFPAMPRLWAKARIQTLEDAFRLADHANKQQLKESIIAISVEHQILCRFTAWLAVDEAETIEGHEDRIQMVQPVEMPQSWNMTTTGALPPPPVMVMPAGMPMSPSPMAPPMPLAQQPPASRGGGMFKKAKRQAFDAKAAAVAEESLADFEAPAEKEKGTLDADFATMASYGPSDDKPAPPAEKPGLIGKLMEWVSPAKKQDEGLSDGLSDGDANAQAPRKLRSEAKPADQLQMAISAFLQRLGSALDDLAASRPVDAQALASSREDLLQKLGQSERAERLPALQRLLRQESQRLIKALQAGTSEGLEPLLDRCRQQLELAKSESNAGAFWEETI